MEKDMMNNKEFTKYLMTFEIKVIEAGILKGVLGKKEMVPVRSGKLATTPYGRLLGRRVRASTPFVIDYYGYFKKSNGIDTMITEISTPCKFAALGMKNSQIKMISAYTVHFAALKIDEVNQITKNLEILAKFPAFKDSMLKLRGFRKRR